MVGAGGGESDLLASATHQLCCIQNKEASFQIEVVKVTR